MTRRRVMFVGVVACLVVASAVICLLRPTSINRTQFDAIAEGMMRAEVQRLLGGPPRNECQDDVIVWVRRQGKRVSAECSHDAVTRPRICGCRSMDRAIR